MKRLISALPVLLAACEAQPRSGLYFEAHPEVAHQVVEACRADRQRGEECKNAERGVAAETINKRIEMLTRGLPR